jgi:hypothetical protein
MIERSLFLSLNAFHVWFGLNEVGSGPRTDLPWVTPRRPEPRSSPLPPGSRDSFPLHSGDSFSILIQVTSGSSCCSWDRESFALSVYFDLLKQSLFGMEDDQLLGVRYRDHTASPAVRNRLLRSYLYRSKGIDRGWCSFLSIQSN